MSIKFLEFKLTINGIIIFSLRRILRNKNKFTKQSEEELDFNFHYFNLIAP